MGCHPSKFKNYSEYQKNKERRWEENRRRCEEIRQNFDANASNLCAVLLPITFATGVVVCSIYASKVAAGTLSVLPAGYGLLVAAAVVLAILAVAVPAPLRIHGLNSRPPMYHHVSGSDSQIDYVYNPFFYTGGRI